MRNFKRFLALALAMLMLNGMMAFSVGAAEEGDYTEAALSLGTIGILKGDTNGNLMLDQGVTRWQTSLFFVQAMTGKTEAAIWNADKSSANFGDVIEYGTAIDYAYGAGVVKGRGDGVYGYSDPIVYQDMLVMAVRALGYETKDTVYPYGHIQIANKLGLTDDVAVTDFKAALTRGETAQIIWNMLGTYKALVDPISEKVLYPDDIGTGAVLDTKYERTRMLDMFAQGTIEGIIVDYTAAKNSTQNNTVEIETVIGEEETTLVLAAEDLGITKDTYKSTYLGLPVTLHINCEAEKFEDLYSMDEEESEAEIVFTSFTNVTNVKNMGNEGKIKYNAAKNDITLDGTTYTDEKYDFDLRTLTLNGWESADPELLENFTYTEKEGYTGRNSYGEIDYTVIVDEDADTQTLLMLYKPYEFGRYVARSLKYQATGAQTRLVLIGTYDRTATDYYTTEEIKTTFVEKTLGSNGIVISKDNKDAAVSKTAGQLSASVKLEGDSVTSKEFMFYFYNELDNVIIVGESYGTIKTGKVTAYNSGEKTLRVDGRKYDFGFDGAYTALAEQNAFYTMEEYAEKGEFDKFFDDLEFYDDNNIEYALVGGNVVYMGSVDRDEGEMHNFIITSVASDVMADLLDVSVEKYETGVATKLDDNMYLYIDGEDVKFASLNTSTGEWQLATVNAIEVGEYDAKTNEFEETIDLSLSAQMHNVFGTEKGTQQLKDAYNLLNDGIVKNRAGSITDGYTIAMIDHENEDEYIEYGAVSSNSGTMFNGGLQFTNINSQTNKIYSDRRYTGVSRKALNKNSIVVIIDADGNVGIRTGVQKTVNSVVGTGRMYAASAALIVYKLTAMPVKIGTADGTLTDAVGEWNALVWAASATASDSTWYVATKDSTVIYEKNDDGQYVVTVENLINLKTLRKVDTVETVFEDLDDTNVDEGVKAGDVIVVEDGEINVEDVKLESALVEAVNAGRDEDALYVKTNVADMKFTDYDAITLEEWGLDDALAIEYVKVTLATLDFTSYDLDDYDLDRIVLDPDKYPYDEDADYHFVDAGSVKVDSDGTKGYSYSIDDIGTIGNISEPTSGKFDQYIIDTIGEEVLIATEDGKYFEDAAKVKVDFAACSYFEEETGAATLFVIKTITDAE